MSTVKKISASEFSTYLQHDPGIIIDVRTVSEYEAGHLENVLLLDFLSGEFNENYQDLDKTKTYYLYCRSGNRSGKAAEIMVASGFSNVYNIGGFDELAAAGLPVEY